MFILAFFLLQIFHIIFVHKVYGKVKMFHIVRRPNFLKNLPLLLSNVKPSGRFFQIFVAFSENLNFKLKLFIFSVWMKIIIMLYARKD